MEERTPNGLNSNLGSDRYLEWLITYNIEMEDYCLTLLTGENQLVTRVIIFPGDYTGGRESWKIPESIELVSGENYRWRVDIGAKYINGYESMGAESSWATFLYSGN